MMNKQFLENLSISNVLYISSEDISIGDGPGVNEREFIHTMSKILGSNAHFIIPETAGKFPAEIPRDNCTFTTPHHQRKPIPWVKHQLSTRKAALERLSKKKYDIIVIRAYLFAFGYLMLTRKTDVPYVMKTAGDGQFLFLKEKNLIWQSLAGLNQRIYKQLIRRAAMVDAVSDKHVHSLKKVTGRKENLVCIGNGVNTDRFQPGDPEEVRKRLGLDSFTHIVGYVGNSPWSRGGKELVEALPKILSKFSKAGAVILGSGPGLQKLKELADNLNVSKHCKFIGRIPFDQVPSYVIALDVGISFARPIFGASELKIRQYLACGKPVVTTPGSSSFVEEAELGSVVELDKPEQISKEIIRWLSLEGEKKKNFTLKARKYTCKYLSFERTVIKRLELWDRVLQTK